MSALTGPATPTVLRRVRRQLLMRGNEVTAGGPRLVFPVSAGPGRSALPAAPALWFVHLEASRGRHQSEPEICLQAAQEGVKARVESLIVVVGPGIRAVGGQGGEAVGGQGTEERVQFASSHRIAEPLLSR